MKRKIDEIFRERFRDLKTPPPKESWQYITAALPQKNKRKIIPLWYKLAGTAAALALLFTLYDLSLPPINYDTGRVTIETKKKPLNVHPVSKNFQETMSYASSLLENLKFETLKSLLENRNPAKPLIQTHDTDLAGPLEFENEYIKPLAYYSIPKSINSFLTGIEGIKEIQIENSTLADNTENNRTLDVMHGLNYSNNLNEKDSELDSEKTLDDKNELKRLSIRTTAGAVYYDNFGEGNSLDPQFADNKSSGEFTMAYGINVAYKLNPRMNIRTGVSKIHLSHNTTNIEFAVATRSESLNSNDLHTTLLASSNASNGYLNQALEYIEIPLELEVSLLDKKIGLNIIGGASTFFLDGNMISHNSPIAKTELGEANNLNDLSFSANIGLGLNYNFSPQFQFNLEPIMKYQLNTFNKGAGLNPYIIGIYSGLTLKF